MKTNKRNLIRITLMAIGVMLLIACKHTTATVERSDGTKAKFKDTRALMNTKAKVSAEYDPETRKFKFDSDVASSPEAEMVEAAARGAVSGLSGRLPQPAPAREPQPEPQPEEPEDPGEPE